MFKQFLRKKTIDRLQESACDIRFQLKRSLGVLDLIFLGIGAIIGTGIFAVIGTAAAGGIHHLGAGPAVSVSLIITAIACGFCAMCYAEFASLVPISGSAYTYAYATLGELVAWIIGWDLILEYAVGNVAVAIGWAAYFHQLCNGLGLSIPAWLSVDWRTSYQAYQTFNSAGIVSPDLMLGLQAWQTAPKVFGVPVIFNLLAAAIVFAITILLYIGIKESARANNIMVLIKLAILGFFIAVGVFYVKPENWTPFMPNGMAGVWAGASLIFFAYIGFDALSTVAEECKNPARDLPIGIIGSLVICTVIYIIVAFVLTGIAPWNELGVADPLAAVFSRMGLNWIAGIISLGAVVSMTGVLLIFQLGQPRLLFAMSRDGLLPSIFSKVHPRFRTPHVATVWTGLFVGGISTFTNINEIVELSNIGTLFAFLIVCAGILVLRKTEPERPRGFKVPFTPFIPILGIISCLYLMLGLPSITWIRFFIWLICGLVIYSLFGYQRSKIKNH